MVEYTNPLVLEKLRGLTAEGDRVQDGDDDGSQGDHGPHKRDSWRDPALDLHQEALAKGGMSQVKEHPLLKKSVSTAVDNRKMDKKVDDNPDAEMRHKNELQHRLKLGKRFNPGGPSPTS